MLTVTTLIFLRAFARKFHTAGRYMTKTRGMLKAILYRKIFGL
jgi:hypothetical protein